MAELYGKHDGCCGGRGGTMHLYDRAIGLFGTNGLVGGGIATRSAPASRAQHRGTDGVAVAFFGDGATNHAAFHEALNFAGVRRAPVVLRLREQPLCDGDGAVIGDAQSGDRLPRRGLRHSRRRGRRQRRRRRLAGDARGGASGRAAATGRR